MKSGNSFSGNYLLYWKILKYFTWALCVLIALHESRFLSDFDISISASRDLLEGKNIYAIRYHEWFHYYYSLFFAIIISPITGLPLYWRNLFWLGLNLAFTYRIWKLLRSYLPLESLNLKSHFIFSILSLAMIFTLWRKNMQTTQMTIFILYLAVEGMTAIVKNRNWMGSSLIALSINIKILPLVLMPYMLYRAYFRSFFFVLIFLGLLFLIPWLLLDELYFAALTAQKWMLMNPADSRHVLDVDEESFHSLTTLLSTLLVENAGTTPHLSLRRHVANLDYASLQYIVTGVRIALIVTVLGVIRSRPFTKSAGPVNTLYEFAYICLLVPLIFPHQQHYSFFMAFPALVYMSFFAVAVIGNASASGLRRAVTTASLIIIFLIFNSYVIAEGLRHYFEHFKTLTYAALLLLLLLYYSRPDLLKSSV